MKLKWHRKYLKELGSPPSVFELYQTYKSFGVTNILMHGNVKRSFSRFHSMILQKTREQIGQELWNDLDLEVIQQYAVASN